MGQVVWGGSPGDFGGDAAADGGPIPEPPEVMDEVHSILDSREASSHGRTVFRLLPTGFDRPNRLIRKGRRRLNWCAEGNEEVDELLPVGPDILLVDDNAG